MAYRLATAADYPQLAALWQRSVAATHDFLAAADFAEIREQLPQYFAAVKLLMWFEKEQLLGFSGVLEGQLEMLFLDPPFYGQGYGKRLLKILMEEFAVTKVTVNQENQRVHHFYLRAGFHEVGRSETDEQGKAYPIIYLSL